MVVLEPLRFTMRYWDGLADGTITARLRRD